MSAGPVIVTKGEEEEEEQQQQQLLLQEFFAFNRFLHSISAQSYCRGTRKHLAGGGERRREILLSFKGRLSSVVTSRKGASERARARARARERERERLADASSKSTAYAHVHVCPVYVHVHVHRLMPRIVLYVCVCVCVCGVCECVAHSAACVYRFQELDALPRYRAPKQALMQGALQVSCCLLLPI